MKRPVIVKKTYTPQSLMDQTRQAVIFFSVILGLIVLTYAIIWGQDNVQSWSNHRSAYGYSQLANLHTGSAKLDATVRKQIAAYLEADKTYEYYVRIFFIVLVILLLLAWLIISRINRQAQLSLVESHAQLASRNQELAELNATLEKRVSERTASLSQALEDLSLTQKQLLESEKFAAIGQLASGFAHEINNPIGYINSNLQTLQKYLIHYRNMVTIIDGLQEALNTRNQHEAVRQVNSWIKTKEETNFEFINADISNLIAESQAGVEKIRKIVMDVHDFAKPDRGEQDTVNIQTLVESVLNIIANQIKYKANVVKDIENVPRVKCNPQKIAQVFVNLLMNAVQSIPNKGEIGIRIFQSEHYVCVAIRDSGVGISAENFSKIFDPFYTTKGSAAGLGLSASYDIVRKHNGRLTVDSQVGKGSTFTVCLPYC